MHVTLHDTHDKPCTVPNADISVHRIASSTSATNKFQIYMYTGAINGKRYQWYLLYERTGQDGHYLLADNVTLHWTPQVQASIPDQFNLSILRIPITHIPNCNVIEQIMNHTINSKHATTSQQMIEAIKEAYEKITIE